MKVLTQLCIRSHTVTAENGDSWTAEQGRWYTTSVPEKDKDTVVVFSNYWVPVPKERFVPKEEK